VFANRNWHYLLGRGLVSTPDNFGKLGAKPTHPELLDFLANRMVEKDWSIKEMIRFIVLSKTWQQTSLASIKADEIDPVLARLNNQPDSTKTVTRKPVVSDAQLLAELSPTQADQIAENRERISRLEQELKSIKSAPGPHDPLARVAHAIFNLKEFIYVQ
jgi:hypothetical protein